MNQVKADIIIVGHNNQPFPQLIHKLKETAKISGAYRDAMSNSISLDGQRLSYMDLLNKILKNANVVSSNELLNAFDPPNYACFYLANYLSKHGYKTKIINTFHSEREKLGDLLADNPKIVILTTVFYVDAEQLREVVEFVRQRSPTTIIITGGPFIYKLYESLDRNTVEYIIKAIGADIFICDNQGERTLKQVVGIVCEDKMDQIGGIPNIAYKNKGRYSWTYREREENRLDDNIVDWHNCDVSSISPMVSIRTTRSCPFSCTFCTYPLQGGKFETKKLEVLEAELSKLNIAGIYYLSFIDDTFNVPPERLKQICRMMIRNNFKFKWISYYRCSLHDPELVELMAASGCIGVMLGIESADPTVLGNMNKQLKPEESAAALKAFNSVNIMTYGLFIIGFPGETKDSAMRTFEFIEKYKPSFYFLHLYYHDINAPIHRRASEFGIKSSGYSWKHNTMTWVEAADLIDYGNQNIESSILVPLTDFSFETIPYLMARGIPRDRLDKFLKTAQTMLIRTLNDSVCNLSDEESYLVSLMQGISLNKVGRDRN